jgi:hypothetical protein
MGMSEIEGIDDLCPRCGGYLRRTRRRMTDRLVSMLVPVRRYECTGYTCQWQGTLRVRRMAEHLEERMD